MSRRSLLLVVCTLLAGCAVGQSPKTAGTLARPLPAAAQLAELRLEAALERYQIASRAAKDENARGEHTKGDASADVGARALRALGAIAQEERAKIEALADRTGGDEADELKSYARTLKFATAGPVLDSAAGRALVEGLQPVVKKQLETVAGDARAPWSRVGAALAGFAEASTYEARRHGLSSLSRALRATQATSKVRFKVVDAAGKEVAGAVVKYRFYDERDDVGHKVPDVTPNAIHDMYWGHWDIWAELNNERYSEIEVAKEIDHATAQVLLTQKRTTPGDK